MSFSLFTHLVEQLEEFPQQIKLLSFDDYGEPTLNAKLPDMISYARKRNIAKEITLVTNGSMLTPKLNQELVAAGLDSIKISVEALSAEGYYHLCKYNLDFSAFVGNIADLYKRKANMKIFIKMIDSLLENTQEGKKQQQFFLDTFGNYCDYIDIEHEIPHEPNGSKNLLSIAGKQIESKKICPHLYYYLSITPNGDIYPCSRGKRSGYFLGNLNRISLLQAWNGEQLLELRKILLKDTGFDASACAKCEYLSYTIADNLDAYRDKIRKNLNKI